MLMTILTGAASVVALLGAGFACGWLCARGRSVRRNEAPTRQGGQTLLSAADLREWYRFLSYDGVPSGEDERV